MNLHLGNVLPGWLIWLLALGLLAVLAHGTIMLLRKKIPPRWVAILSGLRLAVLVVFLLILLQPVLSYARQSPQHPELLVLVDTSASMDQPGGSGQGSRLDEVRRNLQDTRLLETLAEHYHLQWYQFSQTAQPIAESDLATLKPAGVATRYAESLEAARKHLRALGKAPQRVLLVSDGNDLGKSDPAETARLHGLTIDTLAPAAAKRQRAGDVVISDVQGARRVLLGSETHFRVTLRRADAGKDRTVTVRLSEDGKKIWDQDLKMPAGQAEEIVTLAHRPATTGTKQYAIQLDPHMTGADASKPYEVSVDVLDSKYEVLILEDSWRWEFKYLRRLFEEDPSFRFTALLSRGKGALLQFGSPDRRVNLVGFPQGRGELEGFDTFLLGDVDPSGWPSNFAPSLARLVSEEGKSLIVVAGPNLESLGRVPEIAQLLPVELSADSAKPMAGPVSVQFGPASSTSPLLFQLRGGADKLPPLDQVYPPLRKRPAANVLVEAVKERNSYGNIIVMAEHTVGRGRVLFVGTDTLWKWHTLTPVKEGPSPYRLFWQQALRALTPERSSLGGVQVWLQPERTRGEAGRTLSVAAELQTSRALTAPKIQATVELPNKQQQPLAFAADPANPLVFRTTFAPYQAGPHTLKAVVMSEGKAVAETSTVINVAEPPGETSDQGVDTANLARLAASTGGKLLDVERPDTWPSASSLAPLLVTEDRRIDLWQNFSLLMLLCGLLGVDWVLRIMKGYV